LLSSNPRRRGERQKQSGKEEGLSHPGFY